MADAHEFTIDTGRGYEVTGRVCVEGDLFDIVLSRADRQPFATGQTEFSVTLSIDEDLTLHKLPPRLGPAPLPRRAGGTATSAPWPPAPTGAEVA